MDTVLSPNNIESCTNLPLNSRHLSRQDIQLGPTGVLYREVPLYLSTSPLHPHPQYYASKVVQSSPTTYLNHVGQSLHSDTDGLQTISHCTTYLLPAHCLHTYIHTYVCQSLVLHKNVLLWQYPATVLLPFSTSHTAPSPVGLKQSVIAGSH